MSDHQRVEGHCLCRAIEFAYECEPNWIVHCHCESCRRAASSPVVTWISVPRASFQFTKGQSRYYRSSAQAKRAFCGDCGSPLTYENDQLADEVHLYAASLADPSNIKASRHVFTEEQLDWFEVHDDLPRYATTSQGGAKPSRHGPK
ncbi:MAG: GFA family protein [Geminicoccaceae bacterium]